MFIKIFFFKSTDDGQHLIAKVRMTLLKTGDKYVTVILFRLSTHTHLRSFNTHYILHINVCILCTGDCVMEFTSIPLFLTFCLHIYFQQQFFISCSCQYSYNLMLTATYMFRSYVDEGGGGNFGPRAPVL